MMEGLTVSKVENYILIREIDSVAVDYAFYRSINHAFDSKPSSVLFLSVGFDASQAYIIEFSKDSYRIVSEVSSREVNSSQVDACVSELMFQSYEEQVDLSDEPNVRENPEIPYRMFSCAVTAKHNLSDPRMCIK